MGFPHPKPRKEKYRKEDIPNSGGVVGNFLKRTVNITNDRDAKDDVNPAKNRSFCTWAHDVLR
jgi:hypothetical protein